MLVLNVTKAMHFRMEHINVDVVLLNYINSVLFPLHLNVVLLLLWLVKIFQRSLNGGLMSLKVHLCFETIRSSDSIKPIFLILYWSPVAVRSLHSICLSDHRKLLGLFLSVAQGHYRAEASRRWNLITELQLSSGLPYSLLLLTFVISTAREPGTVAEYH